LTVLFDATPALFQARLAERTLSEESDDTLAPARLADFEKEASIASSPPGDGFRAAEAAGLDLPAADFRAAAGRLVGTFAAFAAAGALALPGAARRAFGFALAFAFAFAFDFDGVPAPGAGAAEVAGV
jgi:hypothetical protein